MTSDDTPGRLNIYDGLPFRVIVDYAHNVHGLKAFCEFTGQLDIKGRRIVVLSADGKKSDDEIKRIAGVLANEFDYFICRGTKSAYFLGGRNKGEIAALIKSTLIEHHIGKDKIEIILDPEEAVDKALSIANPEDLLVIFYGHSFWEKIKNYSGIESKKPHLTINTE